MATLDNEVLAVVAAFQRWTKGADSAEIEGMSLDSVRKADVALGGRDINASFRLAMKRRIGELEAKENSRHQSVLRAVAYVVTFALGVLSAVVAELIMK